MNEMIIDQLISFLNLTEKLKNKIMMDANPHHSSVRGNSQKATIVLGSFFFSFVSDARPGFSSSL
jgi:hypothetical protein